MREAWMLAAALLCATAGMAWLALAMETHWQQVLRGSRPPTRLAVIVLRALGASALAVSLVLCLGADHGSMAVLVWVMALAAGALVVAFTLAWRPRTLAPLLTWSNGAGIEPTERE